MEVFIKGGSNHTIVVDAYAVLFKKIVEICVGTLKNIQILNFWRKNKPHLSPVR